VVAEPIEILPLVTATLDRLGIPWVVGGSIASSLHGEPRLTNDADLVVEIGLEGVRALTTALAGSFYVNEEAAEEAVRRRSSFNVIHTESLVKIDLFILRDDPLDREQMRTRQRHVVDEQTGGAMYITSAEVVVLRKLDWFRRGGEISDRQLLDAVAIIKVQGDRLDMSYLGDWADRLGLQQLLARALRAAGR